MLKEIEISPVTITMSAIEALELNNWVRKYNPVHAKLTGKRNVVECPTCGGETIYSFTSKRYCHCIHCGQYMRRPEPLIEMDEPGKSEFPYEDEMTGDKE